MPTDFNSGFNNDDIIEAEHVKQFAKPVSDLESGVAFFREATNTDEVFEVDFSESAIPGGAPGHVLESLEPGQMIVFKASTDSQVDAELEVTLEGSSPESYPLFAGNTQIGQGEIKENQIVVAIFNDEDGGRFDVVGVTTESSGGGGRVEELDDLDDVTITSPTTGEVLRFDGTEFVNAEVALADVDGLSVALNGKQDELTGVGDVPGLSTALDSKQDELTGVGDVPGLSTALNSKQDELTGVGDVPGLSTALDGKQSLSEKGQPNGYASLDAGGLVPAAQLPDSGGGADWGEIEGTLSDQTDLQGALDGKAATSHTHSANQITSGTLAAARIPNLSASKITSGTLPIARGGTGATSSSTARTNLDVPSRPTDTTGTSIPSSNRYPLIFASTSLPSSPISSLGYHQDIAVASQIGDLVHRFLVAGSFQADRFITYPSSSASPTGTGTNCVINFTNGTLVRQTSQSKLKKNQEVLRTTIEEILAWQPKSFQWVEPLGGHEDIGLIAEEVAELDSRAVCYDHDQTPEYFGVDPKKCTGYRPNPEQPTVPVSVHYERAWVHLLAATQDFYRRYQDERTELVARIEALESAR